MLQKISMKSQFKMLFFLGGKVRKTERKTFNRISVFGTVFQVIHNTTLLKYI